MDDTGTKQEVKNFADANSTLPVAWTTIYTASKYSKTVLTEFNFTYTSGTSAATIQVRILKSDATTRVWGQATLTTAGWQVHFLDEGDVIILEAGWSLQIQETTGASIAYVLQGYETLSTGKNK